MSFIDMMADDVWSDADITRRTEAMIFSRFPPETENIMNRKATGAALGLYVPTQEEQAQLAEYTAVANAARDAGNQARKDMELLVSALEVEKAQIRVASVAQPITRKDLVFDDDGNPVWEMVQATTDSDVQAVDANGSPLFSAEGMPIYVKVPMFDDDGNPLLTELLDTNGEKVQVTDDSGVILNQVELDKDLMERNAAQLTIDNASEEVLALVSLRASRKL